MGGGRRTGGKGDETLRQREGGRERGRERESGRGGGRSSAVFVKRGGGRERVRGGWLVEEGKSKREETDGVWVAKGK